MTNSGVGRVAGWIAVAVAAGLVVVFFAFVLQGSSCNDAASGTDSTCSGTGPAVGTAGVWVISVLGSAVIAIAIWRAIAAARTTAAGDTESVSPAAEVRR